SERSNHALGRGRSGLDSDRRRLVGRRPGQAGVDMSADSSTPNADNVVKVCGLGTKIGRKWLLRSLDLEVKKGETLAVIGASGGGKSLMLRHLIGLNTPSEGTVDVLGIRLE